MLYGVLWDKRGSVEGITWLLVFMRRLFQSLATFKFGVCKGFGI